MFLKFTVKRRSKNIDEWTTDQLTEWIRALNVGNNKNHKMKLIESIIEQGINGEDFNSMQSPSECLESFEEINKNLYFYFDFENVD